MFVELIKEDIFPTLFWRAVKPPQAEFETPFRAVSNDTYMLHFVFYMLSFKFGIYASIITETINKPTDESKSQKSVYFIYFFV